MNSDSAHGHPRVVVGVERSVAGAAALRTAVEQARARRTPLHALRAVPTIVEDATTYISDAFAEALGREPDDLDVRFEIATDNAANALTASASDPRDLIVLGRSRHGAPHAPWAGSVARGVLKQAGCPVLVVPGPEMQRATHRSAQRLHAGRADVWERIETEVPELRGS